MVLPRYLLAFAVFSTLVVSGARYHDAIAQAYTYDPPQCGARYKEERAKPKQLRVVWEMAAAQLCVQQSKYPTACQHLRAAFNSAEEVEKETGSADGTKIYLKTMMTSHGCQ